MTVWLCRRPVMNICSHLIGYSNPSDVVFFTISDIFLLSGCFLTILFCIYFWISPHIAHMDKLLQTFATLAALALCAWAALSGGSPQVLAALIGGFYLGTRLAAFGSSQSG